MIDYIKNIWNYIKRLRKDKMRYFLFLSRFWVLIATILYFVDRELKLFYLIPIVYLIRYSFHYAVSKLANKRQDFDLVEQEKK